MRKLNISIVVGVVVAVLGAGIVVAYGQSVDKRIASGKHPVAVLAADGRPGARAPAGDVAGRVHVDQVPSSYVAEGALSSTAALSDLPAGSVLAGPAPRRGPLARPHIAAAAPAG